MIHTSAIAESIVAPTLFRPEFSHSLDPNWKLLPPIQVRAKMGGVAAGDRYGPLAVHTRFDRHTLARPEVDGTA